MRQPNVPMLGWTLRETKNGLELRCPPEANRMYQAGVAASILVGALATYLVFHHAVNGRIENISGFAFLGLLVALASCAYCLAGWLQPVLAVGPRRLGGLGLYRRPWVAGMAVANVNRLEIQTVGDDSALVAIIGNDSTILWIAPNDPACRYVAEELSTAIKRPLA